MPRARPERYPVQQLQPQPKGKPKDKPSCVACGNTGRSSRGLVCASCARRRGVL